MLRYESLARLNKSFKAILIFRDPLPHAMSLMHQHSHFTRKQKEDMFVLDYMNWLGHHEFGLRHKFFSFSDIPKSEPYSISDLSYWVSSWVVFYSYVLKVYEPDGQIILVHYDDLLKKPNELRLAIARRLEIELEHDKVDQFVPNNTKDHSEVIPHELLEEVTVIYEKLLKLKIECKWSKPLIILNF